MKNWRETSGVLLENTPDQSISEDMIHDIWKPNCFRLFLSHKAEKKVEATKLKKELALFGVSCFVAHEDIEPAKEWQKEIEKALFSMDVLVAMMTVNFSESKWTDQEVGVAFGRQIPIIPIRLGMDPYGFIGKYQAMPGYNDICKLAKAIILLLWSKFPDNERLLEGLITRFENSTSFTQANFLIKKIEHITQMPYSLIERLEKANKENGQVREAFEVKKRLPVILRKLKNAT